MCVYGCECLCVRACVRERDSGRKCVQIFIPTNTYFKISRGSDVYDCACVLVVCAVCSQGSVAIRMIVCVCVGMCVCMCVCVRVVCAVCVCVRECVLRYDYTCTC